MQLRIRELDTQRMVPRFYARACKNHCLPKLFDINAYFYRGNVIEKNTSTRVCGRLTME
jgi:hypothetical protein